MSSEDLIKRIELENQKIAKLNQERNKAIATKEVWEERLIGGVADYKEKFGVDLTTGGTSIASIKSLVDKEYNHVLKETTKAFDLSSNLVKLIDAGDVDGAWELVGGKPESLKESEIVEVATEVVESVVVDESVVEIIEEIHVAEVVETPVVVDEQVIEDTKVEEVIITKVEEPVKVVKTTVEKKASGGLFSGFTSQPKQVDDDDDLMVASDSDEYEEDEPVKQAGVKPVVSKMLFDDDDDDFILVGKKEEKKETKETIIDWGDGAEEEEETTPTQANIFGKFGNILSGSKLETK